MNTELTHPHWMNEEALHTLSNGYLLVGETPKDMFSRLAKTASKVNEDPTLDEDLFHCLWSGWIGAASPVASNFGTNRGQPISCFSVHPSDSISSIYSHLKEVAQLSKSGGGVGNYFGEIRPAGSPITGGGKSIGAVPWMQQYDICARVVSQGGVRRGSFAFYLPIDHPDVPELLRAKDHTAEVLRTRMISGTPYLIFIDNANNQNPDCYKERGLTVKTSNLCSEIFLHTDENHSFVCVLSSLNLSRYDEFKDWKSPVSGRTVPQIGIHFLEAVVSEFIRKAKDKVGMGRSVRFAEKSRALGLGVMGLHSLYQLHGLPVKSQGARALNIETIRWMKEEAVKASKELAERFGEPEWCKGTGMRHTHLIAIAPTKTNSVICGAGTEGIEPRDRNYYVAKQAKGTYVRKNQYLEKIFCDRGVGPEVWDQILVAKGSVQGIECLTEHEKEVFKTAREVDQFELIKQAADRQPYVCQGQSLNLFPDPKSDASYITRLHLAAWKMKLKSLYYLKSSSLLTNKEVVPALIVTREGCPWCMKLKNELSMEGVRYEEITKAEAEEKGFWNPVWTTVPQLWLYKKHIGGYTDYIAYKQSDNTETVSSYDDSDGAYNECKSCEA